MIANVVAGTTVRIINTFYNFDGEPQDPQIVKFKAYDKAYKPLLEQTLTDVNKLSDGKYFFDYITPDKPSDIILEFYGEISGNPTVERQRIMTTFSKG